MAIYLVRHGETRWTVEHRHTGTTDVPLTASGEAQAARLQARLRGTKFSKVLSSPMQRALVTSRRSGITPAAEVSPALREFDYGDYEGMTTEEILRSRPDWDLWRDGCPNGESAAEVVERGRRVLQELAVEVDHDYALFGHGHALRALAVAYLGEPPDLCRHLVLSVASISVLGCEHQSPVIEAWNLREAIMSGAGRGTGGP
ncbi:MAG: histidine phosphatase family protein [Candidatus Dormibacteria bacterium]